jgi:GNAT superfamily N-acetyltransferase
MSAGLAVARYEPAFEAEMTRLHAVLAPERSQAFSARYLSWKYRDNPYIAEPLIYLAHEDGRVVGMRGFFGSLWETGTARAIIPCAADLVVDPDYQDKGIATLIMKEAARDLAAHGYSHIFSLSAGRITALGQLTQGFKSIAPMQPVMLDRRRVLDRIAVPAHFAQFDSGEAAETGFIGSAQARPAAMAALVERLGYDGRLRQKRDANYFAWRFANPMSDYRFLYAGTETLSGYIVLAAQHNVPPGPIYILDWEAEDAALRAQLLHAACKLGRRRQIMAWRFGTDDAGRGFLESTGFVPEAEADGLSSLKLAAMAKALTTDATPLGAMTREAWDFRTLYSDFA